MCQKYVPMCLQLVKRQIHRLIFFPPSTSHIAYFLKPSVKCIIDCYVFKNSTFCNHSSRYLGVDVALSVMSMQGWDMESTATPMGSTYRCCVLHTLCRTGQQEVTGPPVLVSPHLAKPSPGLPRGTAASQRYHAGCCLDQEAGRLLLTPALQSRHASVLHISTQKQQSYASLLPTEQKDQKQRENPE